jgi:hypothetical protein
MEGFTLAFVMVVDGIGVNITNRPLVMEKVIRRPIPTPLLNVNLVGITKLMIIIHGRSLQMLE